MDLKNIIFRKGEINMKSLTGRTLLDELNNLTDEELNLPIKIFDFDNENMCYKDLKGVVALKKAIVLPYVLTSKKK